MFHWDGSFEYPQLMFWLRNYKNITCYALLNKVKTYIWYIFANRKTLVSLRMCAWYFVARHCFTKRFYGRKQVWLTDQITTHCTARKSYRTITATRQQGHLPQLDDNKSLPPPHKKNKIEIKKVLFNKESPTVKSIRCDIEFKFEKPSKYLSAGLHRPASETPFNANGGPTLYADCYRFWDVPHITVINCLCDSNATQRKQSCTTWNVCLIRDSFYKPDTWQIIANCLK